MRKWLLDLGLIAFLATALAAPQAAFAQLEGEEEEEEFGDDEFGDDEFGDDEFGEDDFGEEEAEEEAAAEEAAPEGAEGRSMVVLPPGGILVYAPLEINLSKDFEGDPISLAPDVWYGVSPELSAGLVHSTYGSTGFHGILGPGFSLQGAGICFTDDLCEEIYDNVGVEARYLFMPSEGEGLEIAANGGVHAVTFDPFAVALKAGVVGSYSTGGPMSIQFQPNVFIGLTERDAGNKTFLYLPASVHYMVNEMLGVMAQTGITGPLEDVGDVGFGDLFRVPLTVGANYKVTEQLHVVGAFSLLALVGGDAVDDGFDGRSLTAGIVWMQ